DDQSVAGEVEDRLAIHDQVQLNHMKRMSRVDADVVQSEKGSTFSRRINNALEHEVARDAVLSLDDAWQALAQLFRTKIGEKAELAEIDAEDRGLLITHLPCRAEDRAVAAQNQGKVGMDLANVLGLPQVMDYDFAMLLEKRQQPLCFLGDARSRAVAQDEDAH